MKNLGVFFITIVLIFCLAACTNDKTLAQANEMADQLTEVVVKYIDETGNSDNLSLFTTLKNSKKSKDVTIDLGINDDTTTADLSNQISEKLFETMDEYDTKGFVSATIRRNERDVAEITDGYRLEIYKLITTPINKPSQ